MKATGHGELDWGVAARALPGDDLCGDSHLVAQTASGIPGLQPSCLHVLDGDLLTLATGGIDSDFVRSILPPHPPRMLAAYILDHYAKPTDDALTLVARWRFRSGQQGESPP